MIACDSIDVARPLAPSPDYRIELPSEVEICSCEESVALRRELDELCGQLDRLSSGLGLAAVNADVDWRPFCVGCGIGVAFDGDGCCVTCGADVCTVHDVAAHLAAVGLRIEPGRFDHRREALVRAWGDGGVGCD